MIKDFALSSNSKQISLAFNRALKLNNSSSTIACISSCLSDRKITKSFRRLRNSGLKIRLVSSNILSLILSYSESEVSSTPKPIDVSFCNISAPTFEVIIKIVFLKSTLRPKLSVKRPSSSTCSNNCTTSGCAFSISSKSTTE